MKNMGFHVLPKQIHVLLSPSLQSFRQQIHIVLSPNCIYNLAYIVIVDHT